VVLRAHEGSIHTDWVRNINDKDRSWDFCISWHGKNSSENLECEYFTHQLVDKKYGAIHALFLEKIPLLSYERVWFPDDDLMASWADINRLFRIVKQHDLLLAQPSLEANGNVNHPVTQHNQNYALRYTNFIEPMCPIFSITAFRICHPTMNTSVSGWRLDLVWCHLLGADTTRAC
jgi:hypothetical protein